MQPNSGTPAASSGNTGTSGGNPAPPPPPPPGGNPAPPGGVTPQLFQQLLAQVQSPPGGVAGGVPPAQQAPQPVLMGSQLQQAETLYQMQLEQLQTMGFHNRQANLDGKHISPKVVLTIYSIPFGWIRFRGPSYPPHYSVLYQSLSHFPIPIPHTHPLSLFHIPTHPLSVCSTY